MNTRAFNWKLAIVFSVTVLMLGGIAVSLRHWQMNRLNRRNVLALEAGLDAYERCRWEETAELLSKYLAFNKADTEVWLKFAEAQLNIRPLMADNINQAAAACRTVLRVDKTNSAATMKLVALFLKTDIAAEAQLVAENFLREKDDPEVRRMLAISLAEQRHWSEAQSHLKNVINDNPSAISAYDTMARIIERHPQSFSDSTPQYWYDLAVTNNPSSAEALIARADFHIRNNATEEAMLDLTAAETLDLSEPLIRLKLARCYLDAHLSDKAREHLIRVREQSPGTPLLWHVWAAIASEADSKEEMVEVANGGLKELQRQPWDFMPTAAELFIRAGEFTRAADCLAELRKKGIAPLSTAYLQGLLAETQGQDHRAIECWRKAKESGYNSQEIAFALARAYWRIGDRQSAIRQLRTFVSENPDNLPAHTILADLFGERGNWKSAVAHLNTAAKIAPNDPEITFDLVRAKVRLAAADVDEASNEVWEDCEKQLSQLEGVVEDKVPIKLLLSEIAMRRNDLRKANEIMEGLKAENEEPSLELEMARVELLICQNENDKAIERLRRLTRDFPQEILPIRYLLVLLDGAGRQDDCRTVLGEALDRPRAPIVRRELVLLVSDFHEHRGRPEEARNFLKDACADMPSDVPLKRRLLDCLRTAGDFEYAQQLVDELRAIEGDGGWQWRWEQARLWIESSDSQRYYPRAIALLKENLAVNPSDRNSLLLLASAYETGGQLQLAVATYRQALNAEPDDLQILVGTIKTLYKAGQREDADKLLNRALTQRPSHPVVALLELQRSLRLGQFGSAESVLDDLLRAYEEDDLLYLPLALVQMRQNKLEEADQLLNELKMKEPNSVPVAAALVELNLRRKMNSKAIELCDEMVFHVANAPAYILRAKTYAMVGDNRKAEEDFDRAVAIEPDNAYAWMYRSGFHAAMGETSAALADIETATDLAPEDMQVRKRAIVLLLASDKPDKSDKGKRLMEKFLAADPHDVDMRLCKARHLMSTGGVLACEEAENILSRIVESEPGNIESWSLWVQLCLEQCRLGEAVDVALRGLAHSPEDKSLLLLKAKAEAARSPVLAIPTLMVLNERDPADVDTAIRLANAYNAGGHSTAAIGVLEKLVASCSETERQQASIAYAAGLYSNNMGARARQEFDKLYDRYPADGQVIIAEADVLAEKGEVEILNDRIRLWSERNPDGKDTILVVAGKLAANENGPVRNMAERLLRGILQKDPNCLTTMQMLAMLLQSAGRTAESAQVYGRILEVEKDNVVVINNLAWILCEAEHRYTKALELATLGLQKAPDYTDLIDTCGVIYYRLGEHQQAVRNLSKCLKMYPENSQALVASRFHLARALAALGEDKGAIENLKISLDMHDKVGGLSQSEVAEAGSLRRALMEGHNNVTVTK